MAVIAMGLLIIGSLVSLVGGIMFLIAAFKESIWWGLGSIFIPIVSLIFLFMHWSVAKRPFFINLAGLALIIIAMLLGGSFHPGGQPAN
jgi:hypothetical protein